MWLNVLLVGVGSFVGGVLRYLISVGKRGVSVGFPWATLLVNIVGCMVIGLAYGLCARYTNLSQHLCLLLTTGLCGGFTTFSTFANESLALLQAGNIGQFVTYVLLSVVGGLLAVLIGGLLCSGGKIGF